MKTEQQVRDKIEELNISFSEAKTTEFDIDDTELILDINATILSSSLALHFLKWVIYEE